MPETVNLVAEPRERVGKGAARAVRRLGRIPAVIYGDRKDPVSISLSAYDMLKPLEDPGFMTRICKITVGGETLDTVARDVQLHPVTDRPLHIDFLRVGKDTRIAVAVPIHFINDEVSPGLKRGGVLNIVRHEVEVYAKATEIPEFIEVDLTRFDINDTVHWSDAAVPAGVEPVIADRDFTIATLTAPSALKAAEAGGEGSEEDEGGEEEAE